MEHSPSRRKTILPDIICLLSSNHNVHNTVRTVAGPQQSFFFSILQGNGITTSSSSHSYLPDMKPLQVGKYTPGEEDNLQRLCHLWGGSAGFLRKQAHSRWNLSYLLRQLSEHICGFLLQQSTPSPIFLPVVLLLHVFLTRNCSIFSCECSWATDTIYISCLHPILLQCECIFAPGLTKGVSADPNRYKKSKDRVLSSLIFCFPRLKLF